MDGLHIIYNGEKQQFKEQDTASRFADSQQTQVFSASVQRAQTETIIKASLNDALTGKVAAEETPACEEVSAAARDHR
jgi:hypothetical protein